MSRILRHLRVKSSYFKAGARNFSSSGASFPLNRLAFADATQPSLCKSQTIRHEQFSENPAIVLSNKRFCSFIPDQKTSSDSSIEQVWGFHDMKNPASLTVMNSCNYLNPFLQPSNSIVFQQSRSIRTHRSREMSNLSPSKESSTKQSVNNVRNITEQKQDSQEQNQKSVTENDASASEDGKVSTPEETEKLTLYQRFKKTYKEHGKVLVAVHLATSTVWFGSFYTAARLGIDVVPLLESWGLSEKVISPFRSGGLGDVALAYLMYKLATPARYTVTIGGTNLAIRYLRKEGRMEPLKDEDKLRSLYHEGKEDLKERSRDGMSRIRRRRKRSKRH